MNRKTKYTYPHDAQRIQDYVARVEDQVRAPLADRFHVALRDGTWIEFDRVHRKSLPTMFVTKGHERYEFSIFEEKEIKKRVEFARSAFSHYPLLVRVAYRIHRWFD